MKKPKQMALILPFLGPGTAVKIPIVVVAAAERVSDVGPEAGKKLRGRLRSSTAAGYKGTSYDLVHRCSSQCQRREHAIGWLNPPVKRRPHPATHFHHGTIIEVVFDNFSLSWRLPTESDRPRLGLRGSLASAVLNQWERGRKPARANSRGCAARVIMMIKIWRGVGHPECFPTLLFDGVSWRAACL